MGDGVQPKIKLLTERLEAIKAEELMTRDVVTTTEDTPLSDIAELIIRTRVSGLPVVRRNNEVIGIITATDLFFLIHIIRSGGFVGDDSGIMFNPTVKFVMSQNLIKIKKETSLSEILNIMKENNAHTLPVFDGRKLVGVIGRRDVSKIFYSEMQKLENG
jgi:CBS domain-containing protein